MPSLGLSFLSSGAVLALVAFSVAGCTQVVEGPETVQLVMRVKDFFEGTAIEGVEMCQADTSHCEMTNAGGDLTLSVPANEEVSWTFMGDGYALTLMSDVTDGAFVTDRGLQMYSDERLTEEFGRLDTPYPPRDTGAVFIAMFPPFPGATFRVVNATGTPFYRDEEKRVQPGLDATTSLGWGGLVEVGPGDIQVEIGGTAVGCFPGTALPGDADNRISVSVREGYITYASILCPPPP